MTDREVILHTEVLLRSTLDSADHLAVLVFLMSNVDRSWHCDEIAERVQISGDSSARILEDLRSAGLLAVSQANGIALYTYAPWSHEIAECVASCLDQALKERRKPVIELIYNRPLDNIRIFADAFRIERPVD